MRLFASSVFLCLLASTSVLAQEIDAQSALAGLWLGGDSGDDEIRFNIEFGPELARVTQLRRGSQTSAEIDDLRLSFDGTTHVVLHPVGESDENPLHILLQTADRAVLWEAGDDDIFTLWRVAAVPEPLLGEWAVAHPRSCYRDTGTVTITPTTISFTAPSSETRGLVGLASPPQVSRLAFAEEADDYVEIHECLPDPSGAWLVRKADDDDFVVYHRPGEAPSWLRCEESSGTDTAEICGLAADKLMGCLREYCGDLVGQNPICDNLQQFEHDMIRVPDCTADMIPFAEEIMNATCEEIVAPYTQLE